jgi:hypothetical protein
MNVRTLAVLSTLGMGLSTAGAMAIPSQQPHGSWVEAEPVTPVPAGSDGSHFIAGQTLTVDGRLGHTALARGADG